MNYEELILGISKVLRTNSAQAQKLVVTAPYRYKHYTIPKRTGGLRDIYHPSASLKAVQRWIVREPLAGLPVHDAVYSYRSERNIAMNAACHLGSNYFIRFDFENFFPSITSGVLQGFLREASREGSIELDSGAISAIARLCCRADSVTNSQAMTIGAPSSPHISNAILHSFDAEIARLAEARLVTYTRYADDVYISSRSGAELADFEGVFRRVAQQLLPYLRINEKKVQHLSRRARVNVTGITITSNRQVSIGRTRKREIRSKLYLALEGRLDASEFASLRGVIAYAMGVEPHFVDRLRQKFGSSVVAEFMGGTGE